MSDIKSEHIEQALFVQWLKRNYHDHWVAAIPNGGKRSQSEAMRLKVEGVSAGFPDLVIPSLFLYIEMKRTKGGAVSKEQKDWIAYLTKNGYKAVVCRGCDEAKKAFLDQLAKLAELDKLRTELIQINSC
jgi:hypothetical protein